MVGKLIGTIVPKQSLSGKITISEKAPTSYKDLINKPSIHNVILEGDKTFEDFGLIEASNQDILNLFK